MPSATPTSRSSRVRAARLGVVVGADGREHGRRRRCEHEAHADAGEDERRDERRVVDVGIEQRGQPEQRDADWRARPGDDEHPRADARGDEARRAGRRPSARGSTAWSARPPRAGVEPCTTCRNWMRMKTEPNVPKLNAEARRRSSPRSCDRGRAAAAAAATSPAHSQSTNATSSTPPAMSAPSTSTLSQPGVVAADDAVDEAEQAEPRRARGRRCRCATPRAEACSAARAGRAGSATTPTGTLIQKIACQFQPSMTAPPMSGPTATPRPAMPPQMPIASGRRCERHGAGEQGERERHDRRRRRSPAARGRAMSWPGSVLSAASAEPSVKTAMPMMNTRAPAEAVAERDGHEDRARERERVRVHEPLQLLDGGPELARAARAGRWSSRGCRGWP